MLSSHLVYGGLGLAALPLALLSPSSAIVVDDDGGPGVDHITIAAAVAAASDGDVIVVEPGVYGPFTVLGKSIDVVARVPHTAYVVNGGISVRQTPAGGRVLLRGLVARNAIEEALVVLNNQGPVVVEDCDLVGADGLDHVVPPALIPHADGYAAARVQGSKVVILRSTLQGGDGVEYELGLWPVGAGGPGLLIGGGSVAIHGGALIGGDATNVLSDDQDDDGPDGGSGIEIQDGEVHVAGAYLKGGRGGLGGEDWDGLIGVLKCGSGGDGGDGVRQVVTPDYVYVPVEVAVQDVGFEPGVPGLGDLGYGGCPDGKPGEILSVEHGTVDEIAEPSLAVDLGGPVADDATIEIELTGPAGAPALLGVGFQPAHVSLPTLVGPLLCEPAIVVAVGALPLGALALAFPPADLAPGSAQTLFAQGVYVGPAGAIVLGGAGTAVVLDAAL